jgi:hypothetical protein
MASLASNADVSASLAAISSSYREAAREHETAFRELAGSLPLEPPVLLDEVTLLPEVSSP